MINTNILENTKVTQSSFTINDAGWTKITLDNRVKIEKLIISIWPAEEVLSVLITTNPDLSDLTAARFTTNMTVTNELLYLTDDLYMKLANVGEVNVSVWQSVFDNKK